MVWAAERAALRLLDQLVELARAVFPFLGIGQRGLALGDAGPLLGQVGVQLDHVLLHGRLFQMLGLMVFLLFEALLITYYTRLTFQLFSAPPCVIIPKLINYVSRYDTI